MRTDQFELSSGSRRDTPVSAASCQYTKGEAAAISIEVMAIESTTNQYGLYRAQDAPPA